MVRSYNRHEPTAVFGLIASNTAVRPVLDADGKTAYVAALEDILVWDVKKGELLATWHELGLSSPVTALARNPVDRDSFAVGYADGSIRLWRASTSSSFLTFHGHKSSVSAIAWDHDGMRLATAGQDTTIVLWDTIAEQGLFRLQGHKDMVTDVQFFLGASDSSQKASGSQSAQNTGRTSRFIASVSKDGLLKIWDLDVQHCVETAAPGDGELWSVCTIEGSELPQTEHEAPIIAIFTGGSEGQIRLWECRSAEQGSSRVLVTISSLGVVTHSSTKKIKQLTYTKGTLASELIALTSERTVEIFHIRQAQDIRKKISRRLKRAREKGTKADDPAQGPLSLLAQVESGQSFRPDTGHIRALAVPNRVASVGSASILFVLSTNALQVQRYKTKDHKKSDAGGDPESSSVLIFDIPGHRADIRSVAISRGGDLVASACSSGFVKIWNLAAGRCLRTLTGGYGLCLIWTRDDTHILVGCKDGSIHVYEVASGSEIDTLQVHDGPVWSLALMPSGSGFISASADKSAKFFDFSYEPTETEGGVIGRARLVVEHSRTLKMTDDILGACFSPDGRLLALALLDSTVKVFFADTLKFYLSLYGHKLPVLSLDISQDSKLIITGSADKNVKIWGLDFGDCHKSIIAHSDSVMCVRFEKGQQGGGLFGGREGDSHRFWTSGKDGAVKFWDGDNFESVQTMQGHHGEVWALDVDNRGSKVVTAGSDRSIRLWEKTDEPLFIEEERERELEQVYQNAGATNGDSDKAIGELANADGAAVAAQSDVAMVTSSDAASMTAAERLIEAIGTARRDQEEQAQPLPPPRSAALTAGLSEGDEQTPERFLFRVVEKIPATQLTDVLLLLPFHDVVTLLTSINTWLIKEWSLSLSSRVLFFLVRSRHEQVVHNKVMRGVITRLHFSLKSALRKNKTLVGFNSSGLGYASSQIALRTQTFANESDLASTMDSKQATKRKLNIV